MDKNLKKECPTTPEVDGASSNTPELEGFIFLENTEQDNEKSPSEPSTTDPVNLSDDKEIDLKKEGKTREELLALILGDNRGVHKKQKKKKPKTGRTFIIDLATFTTHIEMLTGITADDEGAAGTSKQKFEEHSNDYVTPPPADNNGRKLPVRRKANSEKFDERLLDLTADVFSVKMLRQDLSSDSSDTEQNKKTEQGGLLEANGQSPDISTLNEKLKTYGDSDNWVSINELLFLKKNRERKLRESRGGEQEPQEIANLDSSKTEVEERVSDAEDAMEWQEENSPAVGKKYSTNYKQAFQECESFDNLHFVGTLPDSEECRTKKQQNSPRSSQISSSPNNKEERQEIANSEPLHFVDPLYSCKGDMQEKEKYSLHTEASDPCLSENDCLGNSKQAHNKLEEKSTGVEQNKLQKDLSTNSSSSVTILHNSEENKENKNEKSGSSDSVEVSTDTDEEKQQSEDVKEVQNNHQVLPKKKKKKKKKKKGKKGKR